MRRSGWLRLLLAAVVPAVAVAAGCGDDAKDIRELLAEARSAPRVSLPAVAALPAREEVAYTAATARSPFDVPAARPKARAGSPAPPPDPARPRQPLEAHALEELSVVGFLGRPERRSALVRAPAGEVRTVAAGAYLGRNHGLVVGVDAAGVTVLETIPDGAGGWIERRRLLKAASAR